MKRVPQYNGVPPELRRCPKCGLEMSPLGHTHCEYREYLEVKRRRSSSCDARGYLVVVTEGMLNGQAAAELLPDRITHAHPELRIPWFEDPPLPD